MSFHSFFSAIEDSLILWEDGTEAPEFKFVP